MYTLKGEIRNRHIKTLRARVDYLEHVLKNDTELRKIFQACELAAIRAVLACATEVPEEQETS